MPTPSKEGNPIDANGQKHNRSTIKRSVDNKQSSNGTNNKAYFTFFVATLSCALAQRDSLTFPTRHPCGPNEEFKECGTACEPSCANPKPGFCIMMCKINVCQCASGFVRHENGNCVQPSQCGPRSTRDTQPACGPNEKFQQCGTACEPSCDNPTPDFCTEQCILDVCQCAQGYVRNNKHQCVRARECRSPRDVPEPCGQNEQFQECSSCERTCDTPNPKCTRECKPPKCQCSPGFLRNPEGICVAQERCGATEINPCAFTECVTGSSCIAVPYPCFRPPCPLKAVCVNACKDHECPRGQHCEPQNVVCVRAPCPPRPTCVKDESSGRAADQPLDSRPIDPTGADVENPLEEE